MTGTGAGMAPLGGYTSQVALRERGTAHLSRHGRCGVPAERDTPSLSRPAVPKSSSSGAATNTSKAMVEQGPDHRYVTGTATDRADAAPPGAALQLFASRGRWPRASPSPGCPRRHGHDDNLLSTALTETKKATTAPTTSSPHPSTFAFCFHPASR